MKFKKYEFAVLKYVHDRVTGEFINFGVIAYCRDESSLLVRCKSRITRLAAVFPDIDRGHLKAVAKHLNSSIEVESERLRTELSLEEVSLEGVIARLLKRDDSSLQWSNISSGLAFDFKEEIERLYARYVTYHDAPSVRERRTEQDIWRDFEKHLKKFASAGNFHPKKIVARDDELEFKHAWKNGIWHCVEPISFDLADADNMKDKAHRWLGQMTSLQDANEEFKLYMILSRPQDASLDFAFNKAVSILKKIPADKELFFEDEAEKLANEMNARIERHKYEAGTF